MHPRSGYDAIIFDLDGTLAATHEILYDVYASFMRENGCAATHREFVSLDGLTIPEIVELIRTRHGLGEPAGALQASYDALLAARYLDAPPAEGADALLSDLAARKRLALVTAASEPLAVALLDRFGWSRVFEVIVTGESGRSKPAPDLYLECLRRLRIDPARAIAVEDGVRGVEAAVAAEIAVIGFATSEDHAVSLRAAGATRVVAKLGDLAGMA